MRASRQTELREGVRWLRGELLWPMAVILGLLNAIGMMIAATFVLTQEVLHTSATTFAMLTTGAAVGGIIGLAAPRVSRAIGAGPSWR